MRITKEERVLKSIKLKSVIFSKKCHCCEDYVSGEQMWQTSIVASPYCRVQSAYLCTKCAPTIEAAYDKFKHNYPTIELFEEYWSKTHGV